MTVQELKDFKDLVIARNEERKEAYEKNKEKAVKEAIEFFEVLDYIKEEGFDLAESYVIGSSSNQNVLLKILLDKNKSIVGIGCTYDDIHIYHREPGVNIDALNTSYIAYLDREGVIHIKPKNPDFKPDIDLKALILDSLDYLKGQVEKRYRNDVTREYYFKK
nr:MAG TPA: hypothetical protein [Crassvirales sp.]